MREETIAHAIWLPLPTLAKRIVRAVRAKTKIRHAWLLRLPSPTRTIRFPLTPCGWERR